MINSFYCETECSAIGASHCIHMQMYQTSLARSLIGTTPIYKVSWGPAYRAVPMMNVTGNHRLLIANITSDAMHSITVVPNACNSSRYVSQTSLRTLSCDVRPEVCMGGFFYQTTSLPGNFSAIIMVIEHSCPVFVFDDMDFTD